MEEGNEQVERPAERQRGSLIHSLAVVSAEWPDSRNEILAKLWMSLEIIKLFPSRKGCDIVLGQDQYHGRT